jgi:hypothetical protein
MRRTGKLYYLTLASVGLTIIASICLALWDDHTSQYHLWLDIIPQGFGMASLITTTLIVSIFLSPQFINRPGPEFAGNDCRRLQGRYGGCNR